MTSTTPSSDRERTWRPVLTLAALLLLISGTFNVVVGLGFVFDDVYASQLTPFVDVVAWGWFLLLIVFDVTVLWAPVVHGSQRA
jgi:hypothetical protein